MTKTITITTHGGQIQAIDNVHPDVHIEIKAYDAGCDDDFTYDYHDYTDDCEVMVF